MFTKILRANRGENCRETDLSAQPNCLVRAAHAGEFTAENQHV